MSNNVLMCLVNKLLGIDGGLYNANINHFTLSNVTSCFAGMSVLIKVAIPPPLSVRFRLCTL